MSQNTLTIRVSEELFDAVDTICQAEEIDRSTAIEWLLQKGVEVWKLETAIRRYREGELSLGAATEHADISTWRFLDEIEARNVEVGYSGDDLASDVTVVEDR